MFFNFISRFVSLELFLGENHSFLRRKIIFKNVFQKLFLERIIFTQKKFQTVRFHFIFSPRKHSPEIWGKMFFNFISRFVSLELFLGENHSFLRRKLFFKKVFQKIISGENHSSRNYFQKSFSKNYFWRE